MFTGCMTTISIPVALTLTILLFPAIGAWVLLMAIAIGVTFGCAGGVLDVWWLRR